MLLKIVAQLIKAEPMEGGIFGVVREFGSIGHRPANKVALYARRIPTIKREIELLLNWA